MTIAAGIELPHAGENKVRYLPFYPIEGLAFVVFPGEGCESASFGLARYPRTVLDDETGSTHVPGIPVPPPRCRSERHSTTMLAATGLVFLRPEIIERARAE